jgi:hypothetical protein
MEQEVGLDGLLDLWRTQTRGWLADAINVLTVVLATLMWCKYRGYLLQFCNFCWDLFPLRPHVAVAAMANFVEVATCLTQ